ncbi:MAG TPA: hypothetical protein VGF32_24550, partial [Streptosporangiaceae bacterium]
RESRDLATEIVRLESEPGKDILALGGAGFARAGRRGSPADGVESLGAGDEVGHLLGLVDLDVVPGAV